MSEFIDNVEASPRIAELLEFVRRVHDGGELGAVVHEYEAAIESVTPYDVLVIEHTLLEDGVSHTEIKENIEPILETLAPSLQTRDWEKPDPGHPIDTLRAENRAIESHLDSITDLADDLEDRSDPPRHTISELQNHLSTLAGIDRHFVRKENELFPHLEAHWKHDRPLEVMWSIHDDIRSLQSTIEDMLNDPGTNPATLTTLLSTFDETVCGLIFKEEQIIFPVAMETLEEEQWTQIQQESQEIGYFEIEPAFGLVDATEDSGSETVETASASTTHSPEGVPAGSIALGLETGTLELEELQLLLDAIPVDVTYVDENDRVRYFNNPEDRIFPRSGSIIGRTVQNCHPPESIDTVEEILSAFRSGAEERARFWIQNDADFVVIEYVAMRDENNTYRGTLEVTREVSDIRGLTGEQRLIEWE